MTFDEATLRSKARVATDLLAGEPANDRVASFLRTQARSGRLVDEENVKVAQVNDPYHPGRTIDFVWDGAKGPTRAVFVKREQPGVQSAAAISVEYAPEPRSAHYGSTTSTRNGYDSATATNMDVMDQGCAQVFWVPDYSSEADHEVLSCFESWKEPGAAH